MSGLSLCGGYRAPLLPGLRPAAHSGPVGAAAGPREFVRIRETGEVALETLAPSDHLLLQTANSQYWFMVIEPDSRYGRLSGGRLGDGGVGAYLRGEEGAGVSRPALRLGANALFYIEMDGGWWLATAPLRRLIHVRCDRPAPPTGDLTPRRTKSFAEMS